jgi:hypothetical protein
VQYRKIQNKKCRAAREKVYEKNNTVCVKSGKAKSNGTGERKSK